MSSINFIDKLHYLLVIFIIFGTIVFDSFILVYLNVIFNILVILQWHIVGYCIISKESGRKDNEDSFTVHLLQDILKIPISNKKFVDNVMSYVFVLLPICYGIYKIYKKRYLY